MTFTSLIREGLRNSVANRLLFVFRVLISITSAILLSTLLARDVSMIQNDAENAQAVGVSAWTADSLAPGSNLPASRCAQLEQVGGVISAGGILSRYDVRPANQPQAVYTINLVTPGFVRFLWPDVDLSGAVGVIAGSFVSDRLGLVSGSRFQISGATSDSFPTELQIATVAPPSPRQSGADRSLYVVGAPIGAVGSCFVDTEPGASDDVATMLPSWFPADSAVVANKFRPADSLVKEPNLLLAKRYSQFLWIAAVVLPSLVGAAVWFSRRGEFALYTSIGLSIPRLLIVASTEAAVSCWAPFSVAFMASLFSAVGDSSFVLDFLWRDYLRTILALLVLPLLVIFWGRKSVLLNVSKGA